MEKYIGKKLEGRYEILELIGFGGMAIVFKAYDVKEDRYVAVKILKDEYLQSEDFKRRFRNESKAIALLSHPNIVKVFDVNFSDNIQYIVMEYIDGITLKEYIGQQKVVRWKEAVHFTVQILRALQHAHDNGIVHRDIKPQNVMLLEDGTIKVMDFGIARFARETGRTLSDKAIGSVHYISPEQAKGDATDEKTDIYAVGVILYEMLTGTVPFDGDTPVSIAIKQMQKEAKRPSLVNPEIPFGLEEIIVRAMQKDPQLRYQTAAEMLRDIDEFKHNPDVVFEYKYLNRDGTTKYFDRVDAKGDVVVPSAPKKSRSYTMNILAGVAAACVILMCVALYFFLKSLSNKPNEVVLANMVGMTVEQAQAKYPQIRVMIDKKEDSAEYDANVIMEQKPTAGTTVKVNSEVLVTISTGTQSYVVPDFKGETAARAKQEMEDAGLQVTQTNEANDSVALGNVIRTDPPAGAELKKGDPITMFVSYGAPDLPVRVPPLLGKTQLEAQSLLLAQGLQLGNVTAVNSDEPNGTVVEQSVPANERVKKGEKIDIKLSNGVPLTSSITLNISFPPDVASLVDYSVPFGIFVNGDFLETQTVNPQTDGSLNLEFKLEDGLINGSVKMMDVNEVRIIYNYLDFAVYQLDFKNNTYQTMQAPKFEMLTNGLSSSGFGDSVD